jgi:hypothetical protein
LGLTRATLGLSVNIHPRIHALHGEWLCLSPDIEVRLYFEKLEVTTAREIASNDCVRNYVMDHELQHVQFHLEALIQTADAIREYLNREFPPTFRYIGIPGDLAYRRQTVSIGIASHVQSLFRSFNIKHRDIDSYFERQRSYQLCGGEILRMAAAKSQYPVR